MSDRTLFAALRALKPFAAYADLFPDDMPGETPMERPWTGSLPMPTLADARRARAILAQGLTIDSPSQLRSEYGGHVGRPYAEGRSPAPAPAVAGNLASELHAMAMNVAVDPDKQDAAAPGPPSQIMVYRYGHRDARHAIAEKLIQHEGLATLEAANAELARERADDAGKFLILSLKWSQHPTQHQSNYVWYRPGGCGYTAILEDAGRYDAEGAARQVMEGITVAVPVENAMRLSNRVVIQESVETSELVAPPPAQGAAGQDETTTKGARQA